MSASPRYPPRLKSVRNIEKITNVSPTLVPRQSDWAQKRRRRAELPCFSSPEGGGGAAGGRPGSSKTLARSRLRWSFEKGLCQPSCRARASSNELAVHLRLRERTLGRPRI
jgi:hypothetical protein